MVSPSVSVALVSVPFALTTLRLLLGPLVLILAFGQAPRWLFPWLVVVAFFSDWFDGIAARWLGVATPWLRRYDVVADLVFYLAALAAACWLESAWLGEYTVPILGLLGLEVTCQVVHWMRFRAMTATHAWSCKIWSVVMALALTVLLGWGPVARPLVVLTLILGYLAYLDVILILILARQVPVDVVSAYHVWRGNRQAPKAS